MKLALSEKISRIDKFCAKELGIPTRLLMEKSGHAVAKVIKDRVMPGASVTILAGKGNNGGDGYAAACELMGEYSVVIYDVFGEGQNSSAGKSFYDEFISKGGVLKPLDTGKETLNFIKNSSVIVDAIFGTGFHGEVPEDLRPLAIAIRESVSAIKIAIDVPLGINADNGSVSDFAINVNATVELSFIKPGIISYPARAYVGDVIYDSLDIPLDKIYDSFDFKYNNIVKDEVPSMLPVRKMNSHKGTFGKLLMIVGSERYKGAAHLSAEAALRGGVGLVSYLGIPSLCDALAAKYPEIVFYPSVATEEYGTAEIERAVMLSEKHNATLIGSGSSNTAGLFKLTAALLELETDAPLILDADAINALGEAGDEGKLALKCAKRPVILTPHPLEFARLFDLDVSEVQQNRLETAEHFTENFNAIIVLKGAGTIIADSDEVYINTSGSSALAKAGSGDVLAGLIAAFAAQPSFTPSLSARAAVALHAIAGDRLSGKYSSYGVTPSDLPREIARVMCEIEENRDTRVK